MSNSARRAVAVKFVMSVLIACLGAAAVAGCAEHGRNVIPSNADQIATGGGSDVISVTTPHFGKAYVLDKDEDRIVWSGDVHADDKIIIDAAEHRVAVNGRTVAEDVHRDHRYAVFYSRMD